MNSASGDLNLSQGAVSAAIISAAGPQIEVEVKQIKPNGLSGWEFVQSSAGNLQSQGVQMLLHISCPKWGKGISEQVLTKILMFYPA